MLVATRRPSGNFALARIISILTLCQPIQTVAEITVCATAVELRLNNPDRLFLAYHQLKHHQFVSETNYKKLAYTVEEAAELLSLSRAHVYRLLDLGQLGSISIGRSRRITSAQLSDFLKGLEQRSGLPRSATRF